MASGGSSAVVSPLVVGSPAFPQPPPPSSQTTPSPFIQYPIPTPLGSISVDASSTTSTSKLKPVVRRYLSIMLRTFALLFSFGSSIAMAVPPPKKGEPQFSFKHYPEFKYCLTVVILSSVYSAVQLLKDIWDELSYKGFIVSSKLHEQLSFVLDQLMAYLLFSSSSVAIVGAGRIKRTTFHTAAVISLLFSSAAFVTMAASAIRSGYQLSKRMIW